MNLNKFDYIERNQSDSDLAVKEYGWVVFENAIAAEVVDQINEDLNEAYTLRRKIQEEQGISQNMAGTLHHLVEPDNFAIPLLSKAYCHQEITDQLGGKYILNGMNAVIHAKKSQPYLSNMHRDVRTYNAAEKTLLQIIITLDDFTLENGATQFLSGSHKSQHRPNEDDFARNASRAITKKGSIILFDSNIWHAAGENTTNYLRRALTIGFTRPYIKPQFDYSRYLGYDYVENLPEEVKQVLGYNSRIPETLHEYYQPLERRMYKRDQG